MFVECAALIASYDELSNHLPRYNSDPGPDDHPFHPPLDPPLKLQRFIMDHVYRTKVAAIHNDPTQYLLSKQIHSFKDTPFAKRIFTIVPCKPSLRMSNVESRGMYCFLMNINATPAVGDACKCGAEFEPDHPMCCRLLKGRSITARHDEVYRVIHRAGREAAVDIRREYRIARFVRDRPDMVFDFHDEYRGFADHVCTHTAAWSYRNQSVLEVLDAAAAEKVYQYNPFLKPGESFVPISTSTYGVLHQQALDFIDRIAASGAADSGLPFHNSFHCTKFRLIDEILVAIMKGNAHVLADAARYCCVVL
jgi:hypothetical protein